MPAARHNSVSTRTLFSSRAKKQVGLGCWAFGGLYWGGQKDKDSFAAMSAALDCGIDHWDTALAYGNGRSEKLCGSFLEGRRDQVFLATKGQLGKKPESLIKSLHKSLRNLHTDRVDLFYIHWPRSDIDMRPHMELLERERVKGTLRAIGVSNFSIEHMRQISEVGTIDAHQLCYSLYWRRHEQDSIPYCIEHGIPIITYSSLAQGVLTGKFPRSPHFDPGDQRPRTIFFQKDVWPRLYEVTQALKEIARALNCPLQHLALQWLAQRPGVTQVLVGARNSHHIHQNAAAFDQQVSKKTIDRITAISDSISALYPNEENIFKFVP